MNSWNCNFIYNICASKIGSDKIKWQNNHELQFPQYFFGTMVGAHFFSLLTWIIEIHGYKISANGKKEKSECGNYIEGLIKRRVIRKRGKKKPDLFKGVHGFGACPAFFLGAREEGGEFARCPRL